MSELTPDQKKRRAWLSWRILEEKYWYYEKGCNRIDDFEYDQMEREYRSLGGVPCVGFPNTDPDLPNFSYAAFLVKQKQEGYPLEDLASFKRSPKKTKKNDVKPPQTDPWARLRDACS